MVYIIIVILIFVLDLLIKNYVERNIRENENRKILKGTILIRKHHNKGFALNKGSNARVLVAAVSLGMAVFCTFLFAISLGNKGNRLLNTALALLLGGAYSNTYDRLRRKYVVDYFSFNVPMQPVRRIIFNLSDMFIIIGAMLSTIAYGA